MLFCVKLHQNSWNSVPPPPPPPPSLSFISPSFLSPPRRVRHNRFEHIRMVPAQRGTESGILLFYWGCKQNIAGSWLGNSKISTDLRLSYKSYDWLTIELRFSIWTLQETQKSYDWLTIFHLGPSKNPKKLRLTYDWVTIDLQSYNSDLREL